MCSSDGFSYSLKATTLNVDVIFAAVGDIVLRYKMNMQVITLLHCTDTILQVITLLRCTDTILQVITLLHCTDTILQVITLLHCADTILQVMLPDGAHSLSILHCIFGVFTPII